MRMLFPVLACGAIVAAPAQAAPDTPDAKAIVAQERELGRAMIARDVASLSRIVGEDWVCQGATGISDKAHFIADVAQRKLVMKSFALRDVHVRVFGDIAYLMATDDETSSYAGIDGSGTYNWLDVWQKRNGQRVSVATQITKVRAH